MTRKIVFASEPIAYGSRVLVRGIRASLPVNGFANATAMHRPSWVRTRDGIAVGQSFSVELDGQRSDLDLQAIASGPIMDSNALYLPAGRVSLAEAKEREAAQIIGDPA